MTFVADLFSGPDAPKVEPAPTRDTAADAVNEDQERRRRALASIGSSSQMLSGPGGVSSELTGTRNLT